PVPDRPHRLHAEEERVGERAGARVLDRVAAERVPEREEGVQGDERQRDQRHQAGPRGRDEAMIDVADGHHAGAGRIFAKSKLSMRAASMRNATRASSVAASVAIPWIVTPLMPAYDGNSSTEHTTRASRRTFRWVAPSRTTRMRTSPSWYENSAG